MLTVLVSASLLLSPTAFAGYNNSYTNKHNKHYSKQKSQHYNYKQYKKNKRKHNYAGEIIGGIIGGVVIGTILSDSARNTHVTTGYNNARYNYKRPIKVNKTIIVNNTPTQNYRVLNGSDCYLVNHNNSGSEILTQVPSVNCGF